MGSGKSVTGKQLAQVLGYKFLDLDAYIEAQESLTITDIFSQKGEIYFRKKEHHYLKDLLEEKTSETVVALGGGTPCYGNNLELLKNTDGLLIYLNVGVQELTRRLWDDKKNRPVVKDQQSIESLEEFVRKHLFERSFYYNQATLNLKTEDKDLKEIVATIVSQLF